MGEVEFLVGVARSKELNGKEGEIQAERITENMVEVKINLEHGKSGNWPK